MAENLKLKSLVAFHNLEVLAEKYKDIKQIPKEKKEILETQEAKILLTTLNLD